MAELRFSISHKTNIDGRTFKDVMIPSFINIKHGKYNGENYFNASLAIAKSPLSTPDNEPLSGIDLARDFLKSHRTFIEATINDLGIPSEHVFMLDANKDLLIQSDLDVLFLCYMYPELSVDMQMSFRDRLTFNVSISDDVLLTLASRNIHTDQLKEIIRSRQ